MKIHEYQAKAILAQARRARSPRRSRRSTPDAARAIAERLGGGTVVVKAQIHAGGRGKGGGVKVVKGPQAAAEAAGEDARHDARHLSDRPAGQKVGRVLVEQGLRDQAGAVPRAGDRSRQRAAGADGQPRRRRRDREGRRRDARADLQGVHPPGRRAWRRIRRASWRSRSASKGKQVGAGGQVHDGASGRRSTRPTPRSSRSTR